MCGHAPDWRPVSSSRVCELHFSLFKWHTVPAASDGKGKEQIEHDHSYAHTSIQSLKRKNEDVCHENQQLKQKLKLMTQSLKRCRYSLGAVLARLNETELLSEELRSRLVEYEGRKNLIP